MKCMNIFIKDKMSKFKKITQKMIFSLKTEKNFYKEKKTIK